MLHDFIIENRARIIARCKVKLVGRWAPRATEAELERGVPLFLDQLVETVRSAGGATPAMKNSAVEHGGSSLHQGFTIAQVVQDYGSICQAITEIAIETEAPISALDFKTLNLCLDQSVAGAVTEYSRLRAVEGTERTGRLAHELRGHLHSISMAFEILKSGEVGLGGSTSNVIDRAICSLRKLIERELVEVRIGSGVVHPHTIVVSEFLGDLASTAAMDARTRSLELLVMPIADDVTMFADSHVLTSVVSNLLQNAIKFTRAKTSVVLRADATADRVKISIEDHCGGIVDGDTEALFSPYEQRNADQSGMGLGLAICRSGARASGGDIHVLDKPGQGCVFAVDVPRFATA